MSFKTWYRRADLDIGLHDVATYARVQRLLAKAYAAGRRQGYTENRAKAKRLKS